MANFSADEYFLDIGYIFNGTAMSGIKTSLLFTCNMRHDFCFIGKIESSFCLLLAVTQVVKRLKFHSPV